MTGEGDVVVEVAAGVEAIATTGTLGVCQSKNPVTHDLTSLTIR